MIYGRVMVEWTVEDEVETRAEKKLFTMRLEYDRQESFAAPVNRLAESVCADVFCAMAVNAMSCRVGRVLFGRRQHCALSRPGTVEVVRTHARLTEPLLVCAAKRVRACVGVGGGLLAPGSRR